MRTIKFYTLGCKVNQYDTQLIREKFLNAGFREAGKNRDADICLINTCTVTHRADADSLNIIRKAKKENPGSRIIVTGCLAELDSSRIKASAVGALIVKNKDKPRIIAIAREKYPFPAVSPRRAKGVSYFAGRSRAFLKIQDGCVNFCAYCKVPFVRGEPWSKPVAEIVREAGKIAESGIKEIVLSGICLGAHRRLAEAIKGVEKVKGVERIRLSSLEARDLSDDIIGLFTGSRKICRHVHIPLQSGDDFILKRMNRRYRAEDFLRLVKQLKKRVPGIGITTDVLVGFPGETAEHFANTVKLVRRIAPLRVHVFPYSPREGTAAFKLRKELLDPRIVKARAAYLRKVSAAYALRFQKKFLGKTLEVLAEGRSQCGADFFEGYTDNYIRVLFKADPECVNQVIRVKLKKIEADHVIGVLA